MQNEPITTSNKERAQAALIERPTVILLIAVWFGLLAGLGEVSLVAVAKFFLHHYTHQSPHVAWMTPSADAIIFAVSSLILLTVTWRWPHLVSLRIIIFVFALLGFLSVLYRVTWLQGYAAMVLAAGLAMQTSRFIAAHPQGFYRLVRRTLGLMMAVVVILAVGVYRWQALAEHIALAQLPPASADAPNLLLIVLDTVRAQSLSLYGYSRPTTPQLEQVAKTGVRFERAIATTPWTLPSHASMFTGRYPHELSTGWYTTLDSTYPTLAEVLSERGYLTAGFVANTIFCSYESGLNRGFAHYEDFPVSPMGIILSSSLAGTMTHAQALSATGYDELFSSRKTAARLNDNFLSWLSRKDPQRPFFAFLNYFDAHAPYTPPKPFDALFGSQKPRTNPHLKPSEAWAGSEVQAELNAYDNSIAYLDHHLGILFKELQRRGLLENTLVIITSDHGEEFYEHGVMAHGWSTYLVPLHVPLLISFPSSVPAGKSVSEPVTLRDLPATVIDLLKFDDKTRFPGTSLVRYWDRAHDSGSSVKSPLLSELNLQTHNVSEKYPILKGKGTLHSLVVDQYHYIRTHDGREELYDFENDPLEKYDLARSHDAQRTIEKLRGSLEMILAHNRSRSQN